MKRWLAILGTAAAAFALGTAPAAANGPGDPFSTNCDAIDSLAGQAPAMALFTLAGEELTAGTTSGQSPVTIQTEPPVTFTPTSGGCIIRVNP